MSDSLVRCNTHLQTKQDSAGIVVMVILPLLNDLNQLLLIKSKWNCWSDHIQDIPHGPYPNSAQDSRNSASFAVSRQAALVSSSITEISNWKEKMKQVRIKSIELLSFSSICICHLKKTENNLLKCFGFFVMFFFFSF